MSSASPSKRRRLNVYDLDVKCESTLVCNLLNNIMLPNLGRLCVDYVGPKSFQVFVKWVTCDNVKHRTMVYDVYSYTTSSDLQEIIKKETGIYGDRYRLMYQGKQLGLDTVLTSASVVKECTLLAALRPICMCTVCKCYLTRDKSTLKV